MLRLDLHGTLGLTTWSKLSAENRSIWGTGGRRRRGRQGMRWLMASLTRWTWVWVNSGRWWWTGRPGVLQFMGSQRVGQDWTTELNWCHSQSTSMDKQATGYFPYFTGEVPGFRGEWRLVEGHTAHQQQVKDDKFNLFFFFLLYNTVLVLPYIDMNPPWVYNTYRGNQNWKRHMYPNVHHSTVYHSQDMEKFNLMTPVQRSFHLLLPCLHLDTPFSPI